MTASTGDGASGHEASGRSTSEQGAGESPAPAWPHREPIRVRYHEVDLQNVVFNAHYLTFCDIACARWLDAALGWTGSGDEVDWMVVRALLEWQGPASYGDVLDVDCGIGRWGRSSFDIAYRGTVGGRPVFTSTITYVVVEPGTRRTRPVPERMRTGLGLAPAGPDVAGEG